MVLRIFRRLELDQAEGGETQQPTPQLKGVVVQLALHGHQHYGMVVHRCAWPH